MIHDTPSAQIISQKQDGDNIYEIMKAMCPPSYHHNGFSNSCTWVHDVRLHIAGTNELKSGQQAKESII